VGSLPRTPKLSNVEIIERYQAGQSISLIALKCGTPDYHVTAVLAAAGIRLRGRSEAIRLAIQTRGQWASTLRLHKRLGRA
jgi:hypothetical protein